MGSGFISRSDDVPDPVCAASGRDASAYASALAHGRDAVPTLPGWKSPHVSTEDFGELRLRFGLFESLLKASA